MSIRAQFIDAKKQKKKWAMLTAYDAPTAAQLETAGIDLILVGDSLGMVVLGYGSTSVVTMDEMIHHAKAVRRGAPKSFIIGDLPLKGIEKGASQALRSAKRFVEESGMDAVKIEWGKNARAIAGLLAKRNIPFMGHVGLTPQTVKKDNGFRVQGQGADSAMKILEAAKIFQENGAFAVLLECVPSPVAEVITKALKIPTIGIGAGPHCDGQVLVYHDIVGMFSKFTPRFVKQYLNLNSEISEAAEKYKKDVYRGRFPSMKQSFLMKKEEKELFLRSIP